jgi:hypothetical protein
MSPRTRSMNATTMRIWSLLLHLVAIAVGVYLGILVFYSGT